MTDDNDFPDLPEKRKLMLFGRDVSQIPCFRNSFLYGILGGFGSGIISFIATSNIPRSTNITVFSFCIITWAYWIPCRYNYSRVKFEMAQIKVKLEKKLLTDGTLLQKDLEGIAKYEGAETKSV